MKGLIAALILAALAGGAVGAVYAFNNQTYQVSAHFLSADGLVPQNDVVIDGVTAGTVSAVKVAPVDGRSGPLGAMVTMTLKSRFAPLPQGTRADIRPKAILGTVFVQLEPGPRANPPIQGGGSIPIQDTSAPVTLDQVLDLFNPTTRAKIKTLTRQGAESLAGRGPDLNHVLASLPGITSDTSQVSSTLDQQNAELNALDAEFARIADQVASQDQALKGMVSSSSDVLGTLAAHSQQQQQALTHLDSSLGLVNAGLNGHQQDLNQLLREFPGLLQELQQFSQSSLPALGTVHPCVGDIVTTIQYLQSATSYHDANGYMFRVYPTITPARVGGSLPPAPAPVPCTGG